MPFLHAIPLSCGKNRRTWLERVVRDLGAKVQAERGERVFVSITNVEREWQQPATEPDYCRFIRHNQAKDVEEDETPTFVLRKALCAINTVGFIRIDGATGMP